MELFQLNDEDRARLADLLDQSRAKRKDRDDGKALLLEPEYRRWFNEDERALLEQFEAIDPTEYGINHTGVPHKMPYLELIEDQRLSGGEILRPRFLPWSPSLKFKLINQDMQNDIGRQLIVVSGYRTPRHQLLLFVEEYLARDGDVGEALKRVGLPYMSEHNDPVRTAIDFMSIDGEDPHDFANTPEYEWLQENLRKHHFSESFPEGNDKGVGYEPWHWRYGVEDSSTA